MTSTNRILRQVRPRRAARGLALIAVAFAVTACSLGNPVSFDSPRTGRRILFIGNSLTYFYNMPLIVEAMGDSTGGPPLAVDMVAAADFSLQDHITNGTAFGAIDSGVWEIVILQQGPSAQDDSRAELRQSTQTFADRIRKNGGQPALYMVWPTANAQADFPRVIESYTLAAADVGGLLFPVGLAWQAAMLRDSTLGLYQADGLHPSLFGSYLAAAVIYAKLYNRTPVGVPARLRLRNGDVVTIPTAEAAVLQAAAAEATGFATSS